MAEVELVNLIIDGKPVRVPKGSNVIEAANAAGIEIPHYCYHKNLSIAGNCRMCQIKVKGAPKLDIACNTMVKEGMEVSTHHTSQEVADAQAAVLEFLLINHPLDCTVCDQAGHCKLQDYHYQYNARASRFVEDKVHKVKAEVLGPTIVLDGERCILCTRCVRFCQEVTKTSELGVLNRGDRSVIAVNKGKLLDNPLSGTVADLCPVGALTHRAWRFNTRIWFTKATDSLCPGCSTGCNARVYVRDGEVVQVKGRYNSWVNKEWMCDEGRYGFGRFLPKQRVAAPAVNGERCDWKAALKEAKGIAAAPVLVFVSPDLVLEEFWLLRRLLEAHFEEAQVVMAYKERPLTPVESILVSPDYAPNFRGAEFAGLVSGDLEKAYRWALSEVRGARAQAVFCVGERSVLKEDLDEAFLEGFGKAAQRVAILNDAESPLAFLATTLLPGRSVLEKSGLFVNRARRLQYLDAVINAAEGSVQEWLALNRLSEQLGRPLVVASMDRELTLNYLGSEERLKGVTISAVKAGGVPLV